MKKTMLKLWVALHVATFRATKGRIGSSMDGQKLLLLTTTGNKSGKARTVPVMFFEEGGRRFVIASFAGSPQHPAWFKNLSAHPDVTVELPGERYQARAAVVPSSERGAIWQKVVTRSPRFGEYEKKTQGREIPVVELKRA